MRQIVPYKRMLVSSDGHLIPLEDKYFRDNPQTMGFKHGGYVTCVGYITNVIGETSAPNSDNIFAQLQFMVNQPYFRFYQQKRKTCSLYTRLQYITVHKKLNLMTLTFECAIFIQCIILMHCRPCRSGVAMKFLRQQTQNFSLAHHSPRFLRSS